MNRLLILSDQLLIRSDETTKSVRPCFASAPSSTGTRPAADRPDTARHIGGGLQALRPSELPLRRWTRTWSQALSVHQPAGRTTATGLRAQRRACASHPIDRQLSQTARDAQRGLLNQRRTPAAARGPRINHDGPGHRRPRLHQGGRHPGRHDCVFPCCRHPAVQSGGEL